jgi:CubicO group peptidase (beta-lactamase class C family)
VPIDRDNIVPLVERELTAVLAEQATRAGIPGAALAAVRSGRTWFAVHGVASVETGTPVTSDTAFRVGSITKTLTSATIGCRYVGLDRAPAGELLRRLLSHTAGLPATYIVPDRLYDSRSRAEWVAAQVPATMSVDSPAAPWCYSNAGYALAAHLVETDHGSPFEDLLADTLLRPLGMVHTTWRLADAVTMPVAQCHVRSDRHSGRPFDSSTDGELKVVRPAADNPALAPAGFAYSSVADLARFALDLLAADPAVIPPAVRGQMWTPITSTTGERFGSYGLGWYIDQRTGRVGHIGGITGSGGLLELDPSTNTAIALAFNHVPADGWSFTESVFATVDHILS